MIDTEELEKEIARLEWEPSSYPNYAKLADLYMIRNQQRPVSMGYSFAPAEPVNTNVDNTAAIVAGDTDFLRSVDGKDSVKAWAVMDELMETLQLTNRRVYDRVMEKLNSI